VTTRSITASWFKRRLGRVARGHNTQMNGWQLWFVFRELDCLSYVAVLQT